jgi:alanyl-tRNA synthetase
VRLSDLIGIPAGEISKVADTIPKIYGESYPNVKNNIESIKSTINDEEEKFRKTLTDGLREFNSLAKKGNITGKEAFILFSSFGFPLDITVELAKERGVSIDTSGFSDELKNHQELSRTGAIQKFKGGLADTSENSIKYHTATHLLNAALKFVLGAQIEQRGSNITSERLRFDFSHPQKLTEEEKQLVENTVNSKINENLTVTSEEMPLEKAREIGAVGVFGEKYGDVVKVYSIGNKDKSTFFSREICGGPHVENTGTLGKFKILKEEAVSSGVRRIKAVLE